ncbi:MAG: TetR/AcrR family transcriptional regulator [Gammaproteobacteria bacterium]
MSAIVTRERIQQAALQRFRRQGYLETGVDQIIADAGVSKGSFYHAFKSKEALGLETLDSYFEDRRRILADGPHRQIEDPVERALAFVEHTADMAPSLWEHGCLMGSFATDMARNHPAFRAKLEALFDASEVALTAVLAPIAERAGPRGPSATDLARQYLAAIQGAIIQGQAYGDIERVREVILGFKRYLQVLIE